MWDLSLSQASFHSLSKVTLNCMTRMESVALSGGKGWGGVERASFFINSLSCVFFPVASRTCDLEAKQI